MEKNSNAAGPPHRGSGGKVNGAVIRRAIMQDAQALAGLSAQLGYPTTLAQSIHRLNLILGSDTQAVLVACLEDGSVGGWIHVFVAFRVESDAFAELGGFVVGEKHRGRGLGRALLKAVEEWVRDRGLPKLRVRCRAERAEAHEFYRKLGFQESKQQLVFDKKL